MCLLFIWTLGLCKLVSGGPDRGKLARVHGEPTGRRDGDRTGHVHDEKRSPCWAIDEDVRLNSFLVSIASGLFCQTLGSVRSRALPLKNFFPRWSKFLFSYFSALGEQMGVFKHRFRPWGTYMRKALRSQWFTQVARQITKS